MRSWSAAFPLGLLLLGAIPTRVAAQTEESQAYMDSVAAEQARSAGVDYPVTIREAKDLQPRALHRLLQLSLSMDGAGADVHSDVLWDLVQRWGDTVFTMQLKQESREVQERVLCYITMAACDPRTPEWYPLIFGLLPASKRCECSD